MHRRMGGPAPTQYDKCCVLELEFLIVLSIERFSDARTLPIASNKEASCISDLVRGRRSP